MQNHGQKELSTHETVLLDNGDEIVFTGCAHEHSELSRSVTHQSLRGKFLHRCFDPQMLSPVPRLKIPWNLFSRVVGMILSAGQLCLYVLTTVIIASYTINAAPESVQLSIGNTAFLALSYTVQYMPVPLLLLSALQFNNAFAEAGYYQYLVGGALIDFPEVAKVAYLVSHPAPMAFIIYTAIYGLLTIVVFILVKVTFSNFVVWVTAMFGILGYWLHQQTIAHHLISLLDFVGSFPGENGEYRQVDRAALDAASDALRRMTLIETGAPSYTSYWRRAYFKSHAATGNRRVGVSVAVRIGIMVLVGSIIIYALFTLSVEQPNLWNVNINPCVEVCAYDGALGYIAPGNCNDCLCRCLSAMNQNLCNCVKYFAVGNCTVSSSVCFCADESVACPS
jgi:hypothetical protein